MSLLGLFLATTVHWTTNSELRAQDRIHQIMELDVVCVCVWVLKKCFSSFNFNQENWEVKWRAVTYERCKDQRNICCTTCCNWRHQKSRQQSTESWSWFGFATSTRYPQQEDTSGLAMFFSVFCMVSTPIIDKLPANLFTSEYCMFWMSIFRRSNPWWHNNSCGRMLTCGMFSLHWDKHAKNEFVALQIPGLPRLSDYWITVLVLQLLLVCFCVSKSVWRVLAREEGFVRETPDLNRCSDRWESSVSSTMTSAHWS